MLTQKSRLKTMGRYADTTHQPGRENLFKLNVQKSSLGTAGESGSGLGLIVCKELVEMGGGSIHVRSEKGKGTEIGFTIKISV